MTSKEYFMQNGFSVLNAEINKNALIAFLKENYPQVVKDNEVNLVELKTAIGLPVDEKVNGYGLNFIGRNAAKAKYAAKTAKELHYNGIVGAENTQNMLLRGDNLDCLKILKNHYNGKIKCIYIDPPYNTASDEFVYPDKFDAEEREMLGLANISENDLARMEFAFGSKKSHNGWLAFMYPRLMLARDLLSKDGVIFISIDDNEQANLKLLCDDIFGEENFVASCPRKTRGSATTKGDNELQSLNDWLLIYFKNKNSGSFNLKNIGEKIYPHSDERGNYYVVPLQDNGPHGTREARPKLYYSIYELENGILTCEKVENYKKEYLPERHQNKDGRWMWSKEKFDKDQMDLTIYNNKVCIKHYYNEKEDQNKYQKYKTWIDEFQNSKGTKTYNDLFPENKGSFSNPKPVDLIKWIIDISSDKNSLILDFFAGSGTTGHAVMQLNAEDGGNRRFILCQIDEPIEQQKKKEAYDFCINSNLPPVISSVTQERLRRAGEKIKAEIEKENEGKLSELQKSIPDLSFKVFDLVNVPQLTIDDQNDILFPELTNDALSRVYNMIFSVGIDDPNSRLQEVVKDCMYQIGDHYYITNAAYLDAPENKQYLQNALKSGKAFVDGWTASINMTLQNYREDIKIVF
jgi:adenine-specific DNA-methyltransferase